MVARLTRRQSPVQTEFDTLSGVTIHPESSAARRAARLLALLPAILVLGATGTALADAPDTWKDNSAVSPLHVLLVLGVIPLGLFLLIFLLVYLPSMSKSQRYQPGLAWRHEAEWFGGPSGGLEAVDRAEQPALSGGGSRARGDDEHVDPGDDAETRGGASGRW